MMISAGIRNSILCQPESVFPVSFITIPERCGHRIFRAGIIISYWMIYKKSFPTSQFILIVTEHATFWEKPGQVLQKAAIMLFLLLSVRGSGLAYLQMTGS